MIRELSLLNAVHDVFLMMADVRFAYELPHVSDGWIEAFDVETGRTRVLSRRELRRLAGARRRSGRTRSSGWRATPDLDIVRVGLDRWEMETALVGVHGRAAAPEDVMTRLKGSVSSASVLLAICALRAPDAWRLRRRRRAPAPVVPAGARRHRRGRPRPAPRDRAAQAPEPGEVESDPIRCWWKTDRTVGARRRDVRADADLRRHRDRADRGGAGRSTSSSRARFS